MTDVQYNSNASMPDVFRSVAVPSRSTMWRRMLAYAGPAYLVAVGYMDPGNWATALAGGSRFGYALLPVIVFSGVAAIFLQRLALRLGIATGLDLAQACRARCHPVLNRFLWVTCEIAICACDLAELLGSAIALQLLFGIPLVAGVALTALDTLLVLALQRRGFRYLEAFIIALTIIIAGCFAYEMTLCGPKLGDIFGAILPNDRTLAQDGSLYIALGIFGATVMPHNLYLHSAVVQTRNFSPTPAGKRQAIGYSTIDCIVALSVALLINAAILILAATAFYGTANGAIVEIQDAYRMLSPTLGAALASIVFAVALLAAGQNSTVTATLAGQIVMEGFLGLKLSPFKRRLITRGLALAPALVITSMSGEKGANSLLIFSQVVLSMQLGFAVIPLVLFTSSRKMMGEFVNGPIVKATGFALAAGIVAVNAWLVVQTLSS